MNSVGGCFQMKKIKLGVQTNLSELMIKKGGKPGWFMTVVSRTEFL